MAAKIDGHHAAGLPEMSDLGREDTMVAGPAVDEYQGRVLRSLGPHLKMRETHTAAMLDAYADQPDSRGSLLAPPEILDAMVQKLDAERASLKKLLDPQ